MKPQTTLKDVLKPPFTRDSVGMIYDSNSRFIDVPGINCNKDDPENWQGEAVAKTRGWGVFQYYKNGEALQDAFMDFIVNALNERWEREFSEPLRWKEESYEHSEIVTWHCPKCEEGYVIGRAEMQSFFYCPKCGVNLLPPKTMYWKWSDSGNEYVCPACEHEADDDEPYCPSCGVRLLPPEEGG